MASLSDPQQEEPGLKFYEDFLGMNKHIIRNQCKEEPKEIEYVILENPEISESLNIRVNNTNSFESRQELFKHISQKIRQSLRFQHKFCTKR